MRPWLVPMHMMLPTAMVVGSPAPTRSYIVKELIMRTKRRNSMRWRKKRISTKQENYLMQFLVPYKPHSLLSSW